MKTIFPFRMTKALTEMDGPSWREKLPPIPTVPMSVKEKLGQAASPASSSQQNNVIDNKKKGIYLCCTEQMPHTCLQNLIFSRFIPSTRTRRC